MTTIAIAERDRTATEEATQRKDGNPHVSCGGEPVLGNARKIFSPLLIKLINESFAN